jgi:hypothetical protein
MQNKMTVNLLLLTEITIGGWGGGRDTRARMCFRVVCL